MTFQEKLEYISKRFVGFSLEKREEWRSTGRWRCRILPNKQERQNYRIQVHGETLEEVVSLTFAAMTFQEKLEYVSSKIDSSDFGEVLGDLGNQL